MKQLLVLLIATIVMNQVRSQSVGIGTTTPNGSAQLDVSSANKGLLIPRMTQAQRLAIVTPPSNPPAAGLLVYETTSNSFWFYNGTVWNQIGTGGASPWTVSGTHIYNSNTGNVGIGAVTPDERLTFTGNAKLVGAAGLIKFETAVGGTGSPIASSRYAPGLQFLREGTTTNLAKIEYVDTANFANFIRLRMGSTIENGITLNSSNHTGIGTNDPLARLHIKGETDLDEIAIHSGNGLSGQTAAIQFYNTFLGAGAAGGPGTKKGFLMLDEEDLKIGTNSGNTAGKFIVRTAGGDRLHVDAAGNMGLGIADPLSKIHIAAGSDAGLSSHGYLMLGPVTGSNLIFDNNEIIARTNGQTGSLILQNDGGSVRIGNVAVPGGYKFAINGKMICEEVKVKLASTGWPDYVFADNYQLKPLQEIEKFIIQNRHLPNIPSAAEVEKNGIEIGDMQKRMMEKIEELTLYVIELQKQVNELKSKSKD